MHSERINSNNIGKISKVAGFLKQAALFSFKESAIVLKSLWQDIDGIKAFPSLKHNTKTSVLIIGGGIAGILTAYMLHKKNVPHILVEKGRICEGVTAKTTAKITFQHGLIYDKLVKDFGIEKAKMYLDANRQALDMYREICQSIDCDFEIKDNYVYSTDNRIKLEAEMRAIEAMGYKAYFKEKLPIPVKTEGAVCFKNQAQFHPMKFLKEISKGLNIYENTFVRKMAKKSVITDYGRIDADKIIVTTHFPFINNHGNFFLKLYQHRSYVIALEKAQDVNGMYVDEDKKGLSFRNSGEYLLLGGGAHRTGKQGGNWNQLWEFAGNHYTQAEEKYHWATQDCMSLDKVPYIGQYSPKTPELYVASGFNKWGMTSSLVSAMLLSDMVTGVKNDYEEVFNPSRSILKPQLLFNGLETTKNLLTITEKRCPHLGCALKWNKVEHSWDCPCHGSRFTKEGELLDNPANGNLKI